MPVGGKPFPTVSEMTEYGRLAFYAGCAIAWENTFLVSRDEILKQVRPGGIIFGVMLPLAPRGARVVGARK